MNRLLMQALTPMERLSGIQDRLSEGSTLGDILLTLLGLAAFVAFLYVVFDLQRRLRRTEIDDSRKLFRSALVELGITVRQRDLLRRIAGDLHLPEPTVLLLGAGIYWSHARRWMAELPSKQSQTRVEIEQLAALLFPQAQCVRTFGCWTIARSSSSDSPS